MSKEPKKCLWCGSLNIRYVDLIVKEHTFGKKYHCDKCDSYVVYIEKKKPNVMYVEHLELVKDFDF